MCTCAVPLPPVLSRPSSKKLTTIVKNCCSDIKARIFVQPPPMGLVSYCADMSTNMEDGNDLAPFLFYHSLLTAPRPKAHSPLPLCCLRRVTRRRVSSCAPLVRRKVEVPPSPSAGDARARAGRRRGAVLETGRYPLGTPSPVFPLLCGGSSGLLLLLLLLVAVLR